MSITESNYENAIREFFCNTLGYADVYCSEVKRDYADPLQSDCKFQNRLVAVRTSGNGVNEVFKLARFMLHPTNSRYRSISFATISVSGISLILKLYSFITARSSVWWALSSSGGMVSGS